MPLQRRIGIREVGRGSLGVVSVNGVCELQLRAHLQFDPQAVVLLLGGPVLVDEVDASVAAMLRFPSGGLAQFVASFGAAAVDNYRVVGTSGDLELDPGFSFETATRLRLRCDGKIVETQFPQIDHFGAQVGYFSDCIRSGTPPEADGDEGLADMRALIAIERAASTGIPQAISPQPRSRHPTPDMVRLTPVTDRRVVL